MASKLQPPSAASLLFGAQSEKAVFDAGADCGCTPRLTLKNVDRISWFTDRPYRETGSWKPSRLVRQWESLYEGAAPNAIVGFNVGKSGQMVAFEMYKPRWNKKNENLSFKLMPLDTRQRDAITGLNKVDLSDISIFIDDTAGVQPPWYPNGQNMDFTGVDFSGMNLSNASMQNSILTNTNLSNANLSGANLFLAYGTGITGPFANFAGGVLWSAVMENSDLSGANLSNLNAQGVGFQGTNLSNANLQNSFLYQGNFINANLTGANFTGANIGGAQFSGATWGNTTCPNGTLNDGTSPCSGATPYA